jgi:outer membrane protein assembly factor BamD
MKHRIHTAAKLVCLLAAGFLVVVSSGGCGMPRVRVSKDSERYDFEVGLAAFKARHYLDAQTYLKRFLDLHPGHAVADSAQFLLGLSQYNGRSYAESSVEFAILVREFPRSQLRDAAACYECLSYHAQIRPPQLDPTFAHRARGCFNEFLLRYPESSYAGEAREKLQEIADRLAEKEYRLGVMWFNLKRYRASLVYLDELLQKFPDSRWVPDALLWKAQAHEKQWQFEEAIKAYEALVEGFPDHPAGREAQRQLQQLRRRLPELPAADSDSRAAREPR